HTLDDGERVLALAHHDDAGDRFALAVKVGNSTPEVRSDGDARDVVDPDGGAVRRRIDQRLLEVRGRSGRPESAHDELRAARFDDSPADIVIAALQRVGDALNREAVGPQTAGV